MVHSCSHPPPICLFRVPLPSLQHVVVLPPLRFRCSAHVGFIPDVDWDSRPFHDHSRPHTPCVSTFHPSSPFSVLFTVYPLVDARLSSVWFLTFHKPIPYFSRHSSRLPHLPSRFSPASYHIVVSHGLTLSTFAVHVLERIFHTPSLF